VRVRGTRLRPGSPSAAMAAGIGLVPEDRRQQALVMDLSIERNISLSSPEAVRSGWLIPPQAERRFAADWATRLQVKFGRLANPVWTLSGGNQQKVVLAKWLARNPTLLIVDEPTRGIDVGTKAEVHRLLSDLAGQGVAILMISSELPEVLGMADRVLVLFEGTISGEFSRAEANEDLVMHAAMGLAEASA
jgi:rhamnose transport system ATP-binding protein